MIPMLHVSDIVPPIITNYHIEAVRSQKIHYLVMKNKYNNEKLRT